MSDMNDQSAQQPRSGAAAGRTTAAAQDAPAPASTGRPGNGATGDTARGYVPRPAPGYDDVQAGYAEPRGAVIGLTMLAAAFMMIAGVLGFFEGLAAVIRGSFFVTLPNYAFSLSATSWGVVHLVLGALLFIAGAALFADQTWARIVGVVLAAFMLVANFVYLPYYPVWAIVVIALDVFVIWALLSPRYRSR
ncbi:MAG: hypothetical protein JWO75_2107 [Actinomycetia bacterium]|jgi:hypothetical protein|nr:hypothetical protein [Actinomycetes bacterium]